jgi:citrate lyase beta subunit
VRGEVAIAPTLRLAANVFRVSAPQVAEARRLVEQLERGLHASASANANANGNGNGVITLSDAVIDHMVAEVGPDRFLASIDRLTQPQLPLQPAE